MDLIRRTLNYIVILTLFFCYNASTVTFASDSEDAKSNQENTAWPTLPIVQLSLVAGFETQAAYVAKTATNIAELEQRAEQASGEQEKVDLLFATANQVLAFQIEPVVSRQLLGLEKAANEDDLVQPSTMHAHVRKLLGECETTIESIGQGELSDEQQAWQSKAKRQLRLLQGFAAGVEVLTNSELDQAALRDASSRLSILREDSDKKVMSAAGLWQAIVRSKMADPVRALDVLPLALANVRKETLPHSFFARILRCELLARQERYAASLALLTDIEELCDDWFVSEADRADAKRTATWMQLKVLQRWHQSLLERGSASEAKWCVQRASDIIERHFSGEEMSLLRLVPAVPVVASVTENIDTDSTHSEPNP